MEYCLLKKQKMFLVNKTTYFYKTHIPNNLLPDHKKGIFSSCYKILELAKANKVIQA